MLDLGYPSETVMDDSGMLELGGFVHGVIGVNVGVDQAGQPRYAVLRPDENADTGELT